MPLYDFFCDCGNIKELFIKLDEKMPVCDKCGLQMKKAMSTPAFILVGNSWAHDSYGLKQSKKKGEKNN
jgi:putative FmdB family regulatory protein